MSSDYFPKYVQYAQLMYHSNYITICDKLTDSFPHLCYTVFIKFQEVSL